MPRKRTQVSDEAAPVDNGQTTNGHAVNQAEHPQQQPAQVNGSERRQPAHQIRLRNVRAAIWANPTNDGNGVWYAVTVSRSYRDQNGQWHTAENFAGADILLLAEVSRLAFLWICNKTQNGTGVTPAAAVVETPVNGDDIPF